MRRLLAVAFVALSLAAAAEEMTAERFAALVGELSAEDAAARDKAQSALMDLDDEWKPKVEAALEAAKDAESRGRLTAVLGSFEKLHWQLDVKKAVAEATRRKRPLLVVCATGTPDAPGVLACTAKLLEETFAAPETIRLLRERFVILWIDLRARAGERAEQRLLDFHQNTKEERDVVGEGSEEGAVATWVCSPDGKIRHAYGGWWSAGFWRAEVAKAADWAGLDAEKAAAARAASLEAIYAEAGKLEAEAAATEGGDKAKATRAEDLRCMARRYYSYSVGKVGQEIPTAVDDAVEDFVGREMEGG
jgi:hypothetical protein